MIASPSELDKKNGTLVLVVGPSGSGKDTLIASARAYFAGNLNFIFPKRVITRTAQVDAEDHDTITAEEFARKKAQNHFAVSWHAHGLDYGIRSDILDILLAGRSVIINVSRSVIGATEQLGFPVIVISILCRPELLAERIAKRGRESADDILLRLKRESPVQIKTAKLIEIRNESEPDEAIKLFITELQNLLH